MGWPQITWIALAAGGVAISLVKHGQSREGKTSIWVSIVRTAITAGLLFAGGFFS